MKQYVYVLSGYSHSHEFIDGVYAKMADAQKRVLTNYDLTRFTQTVKNSLQISWEEEDGYITIEAYPIL
jgi:hypothetical protein